MHAAQKGAYLTELRRGAESLGGYGLLRTPYNFGLRNSLVLGSGGHAAAEPRGVEAARQQIVDGNVLVCHAACNAGNESSKSRACRTRQIEPGKRHFDAEGCDVHDSAESARRHSIDHFLDEFNGSHHIHGDTGQQRLPIQISEVPEGWATVIIDEN